MSSDPNSVDRVLNLAEAVCDENASPDEFIELDSIVLADKTCRRHYWDYCRMHIALEMDIRAHRALQKLCQRGDLDSIALAPWESDALTVASPAPASIDLGTANVPGLGRQPEGLAVGRPEDGSNRLIGQPILQASIHDSFPPAFPLIDATSPNTVGPLLAGWPVAYCIAAVIFGVGLLASSHMHVSLPASVADRSSPPSSPAGPDNEPNIEFVGRISAMVDCRWADRNTAVPGPVAVPLGRKYSLSSGMMEITYNTGAKVILQGPVTYEVDSRDGGYLSVGKLTARVEKKEERRTKNEERLASNSSFLIPHSYFAVRTPTANVTDLGTEFGVTVLETGITQVHVLQGVVETCTVGLHGASRVHECVTEGLAVEIGQEHQAIQKVAFAPQSFARMVPRPAEAAKTGYRKVVLADNPIGYWCLGEAGSTTAIDLANRPAPPHCGAQNGTAGAGVTLGSAPGAIAGDADKAANFDGTGCITVEDSEPFNFDMGNPFTIEAWFKTSAEAAHMGIVSKDRHLPGSEGPARGYFLGVGDLRNGLGFGPYVQLEGDGVLYRCAGGGLNDGRWHHLVARYNGDPGVDSLTLFVDGKKIDAELTLPAGTLRGNIQNNAPLRIGDRDSDHPFVGVIDEAAVYGWALDDESIVRHFETGVSEPSTK